jgi:putative intracellular protease/amidase
MTTIVTILTDGFADWETALLNAAARSFYGMETRFATPGGKPVRSSGGMLVEPDMALETLDVGAVDAVIVCGGTIWQSAEAPDLTALFAAVAREDKLLGLICDATVAAAKAGVLDRVRHTSNGVGYLDATGYGGAANYVDTAGAVRDGSIVTAPGTAPVRFMGEILAGLGLADENLAFYEGMHAAQFARAA